MSTTEIKKELRYSIKLKKNGLDEIDAASKANLVFARVEMLDEFITAKNVLAFWSLPDEICTHDFVSKWFEKKHMYLPVISGKTLEVRNFTGIGGLSIDNSFGVMEPTTGQLVDPALIDFALIPGVAFDKNGNRIGRGKGYYDHLLPQLTNALTVGIGFDFQLVESIPTEAHDIPVKKVICY